MGESLINPSWWSRQSFRTKAIILAGALVLIGVICWAYSGGKSENPLIENIGRDEGKNAVISNQVKNAEVNVNEATNNTNQAVNDMRNSINRDSREFNGSGAGDRFCRDFPEDSSCKH